MTAKDRYKVLNNAIARAGGIENVDLYSELAKSESILNGMQGKADYDTVMAENAQNNAITAPISPEPMQSTTPM